MKRPWHISCDGKDCYHITKGKFDSMRQAKQCGVHFESEHSWDNTYCPVCRVLREQWGGVDPFKLKCTRKKATRESLIEEALSDALRMRDEFWHYVRDDAPAAALLAPLEPLAAPHSDDSDKRIIYRQPRSPPAQRLQRAPASPPADALASRNGHIDQGAFHLMPPPTLAASRGGAVIDKQPRIPSGCDIG